MRPQSARSSQFRVMCGARHFRLLAYWSTGRRLEPRLVHRTEPFLTRTVALFEPAGQNLKSPLGPDQLLRLDALRRLNSDTITSPPRAHVLN